MDLRKYQKVMDDGKLSNRSLLQEYIMTTLLLVRTSRPWRGTAKTAQAAPLFTNDRFLHRAKAAWRAMV